MNKDSIIKASVGLIAFLLLIFFYLSNKESKHNWKEHYKIDSKDPFGTFLFFELLKSNKDDSLFQKLNGPLVKFLDSKEVGSNYIFINENTYHQPEDLDMLASYVSRGNNAYVFTNSFPYTFLDSANMDFPLYFNWIRDSVVTMSIKQYQLSSSATYTFRNDEKNIQYEWGYLDSLEHSRLEFIGQVNESNYNYFRLKHGRGSFYFHLSPIVFTNYFMTDEAQFEYAQNVFASMNEGKVFWDDFSHRPYNTYETKESPLVFILEQESLRWAWYLLLGSGLIYLLLYTKRRQRVIPVKFKLRNTSLDFVKTIGAMYYQQNAHLTMIQHQRNLFLTFVREHYGLAVNNVDKKFVHEVSLKSGVKKSTINMIIGEAYRLEKLEVKAKDLIAYNEHIYSFYTNCK